jgi:hypothetical protein
MKDQMGNKFVMIEEDLIEQLTNFEMMIEALKIQINCYLALNMTEEA